MAKSLMPVTTITTAPNAVRRQGTGKSGDLSGVAQLKADRGVHPLPEDFPVHLPPSVLLGKGEFSGFKLEVATSR